MKDSVANRARIPFSAKLRLGMLALRENGPLWCLYFGLYYLASRFADRAYAAMTALRLERGLPGLNSVALNKAIWETWNWDAGGAEWGGKPWQETVIRNFAERYLPRRASLLEIGPGAGRWSEALIERSSRYVGLDLSRTSVELCRQRFGADPRARFLVGSGRDLAGVADDSVDGLWSYDVFVHINQADVRAYAAELARVLRPGATAIIHHGGRGGSAGGWRSDLTQSAMLELLRAQGFEILASVAEWDDDGAAVKLPYGDFITVFRAPMVRA